MANEIESISQGNYILHNIDAKKLYVQEPLFTANSGDAVYVGWRPDETVLWSGTSNTSPITASEPLSSFEKVEIVWEHNYNNTVVNHFNYTYQMPTNELFAYGGRTVSNGFTWFMAAWTIGGDGKTLTRTQSKYAGITTGFGTPTDSVNLYPIKVIGVGRKENA